MNIDDVKKLPDSEYDEFVVKWRRWLDAHYDEWDITEEGEVIDLVGSMPEEAKIAARLFYEGAKFMENVLKIRSQMNLD